jgi:fluoroquinolone resistance protein
MNKKNIYTEIKEGVDFSAISLPDSEFENTNFVNCNFANAHLKNVKFTNCQFHACNLSNANLHQTAIREVCFIDCKMLGMHFEECNEFLFATTFQNCILNFSSFYLRKLSNTIFTNCQCIEVDFAGADLSKAVFDNCNLSGAVFENTNLQHADFTTAMEYIIHPEKNKIKHTKFSLNGLPGLLIHHQIIIE